VWYRVGEPGDNLKLGREAGEEIRAEAGEKFFEELMAYVQDIQVHAHCDVCLCVAWLARAPAPWLVTRWTRSLSFWPSISCARVGACAWTDRRRSI